MLRHPAQQLYDKPTNLKQSQGLGEPSTFALIIDLSSRNDGYIDELSANEAPKFRIGEPMERLIIKTQLESSHQSIEYNGTWAIFQRPCLSKSDDGTRALNEGGEGNILRSQNSYDHPLKFSEEPATRWQVAMRDVEVQGSPGAGVDGEETGVENVRRSTLIDTGLWHPTLLIWVKTHEEDKYLTSVIDTKEEEVRSRKSWRLWDATFGQSCAYLYRI